MRSGQNGANHETRWGRRRHLLAAAVLAGGLLLAACSSSSSSTTTTASAPATLHILVTNDDGVGAPGIDAAVNALVALPHTQVTVVAPLTNQSGTGAKTTMGTLTVSPAKTASGYPATAVHGYPADTIVWAIDDHGVSQRPQLVVSGINFGQNIGPLADISGTVGAARAAVTRGIPALATSQGVDNGQSPNFSQGAHQLVLWVQSHRAALLNGGKPSANNGNLNIPTCVTGTIRGPINVPQASSLTGINIFTVDCTSTATNPASDAAGFVEGFAVIAPLDSGTS